MSSSPLSQCLPSAINAVPLRTRPRQTFRRDAPGNPCSS